MEARFVIVLPLRDTEWGGSNLMAGLRRLPDLVERDVAEARCFASAGTVVRALGDGHGAAIGTVFRRSTDIPNGCDRALTQEELGAIDVSALERDHWGAYIAIHRGALRNVWSAIRDPSGMIPLYHVAVPGADLLVSDVDMLRDVGIVACDPAMPEILQWLLYPGLRAGPTGLRGVTEILPGERWTRSAEGQVSFESWWRPSDFLPVVDRRDGGETDIAALEAELVRSIGSWGAVFPRQLVEVSGGLDSSLIAAFMAPTATELFLINHRSSEAAGDEHRYARAIADAIGRDLALCEPKVDRTDLLESFASHLPRPSTRGFIQDGDRLCRALAVAYGLDTHLNGGGGDAAFCYLHSSGPVIDQIADHGLGLATLRTILDMAGVSGANPWTVARKAIGRIRRPVPGWRRDVRFLGRAMVEQVGEHRYHPWLDGLPSHLPGKVEHVVALLTVQAYLDAFDRGQGKRILYPLISQPLVELCLSIPSYAWCRNGLNRAPARAAAGGRLPPLVAQRRRKGNYDDFVRRTYQRQRDGLKALLLDGILAAVGVVDPDAVRAHFDGDPRQEDSDMTRILHLTEAELWARAWS